MSLHPRSREKFRHDITLKPASIMTLFLKESKITSPKINPLLLISYRVEGCFPLNISSTFEITIRKDKQEIICPIELATYTSAKQHGSQPTKTPKKTCI